MWDLPHEGPKYVRFKILGNDEIIGKSQNSLSLLYFYFFNYLFIYLFIFFLGGGEGKGHNRMNIEQNQLLKFP